MLEDRSLGDGVWEDAVRYATVVSHRVVKDLDVLLRCWELEHIELVVGLLHHFLPICVVVVVLIEHEVSVKKLWFDCFLVLSFDFRQLYGLPGAEPVRVEVFKIDVSSLEIGVFCILLRCCNCLYSQLFNQI